MIPIVAPEPKHQTPNTNTLQNKHTNATHTKAHKLTTHETPNTLHRFYKYKNIIISQNIPPRRRLNWQHESDNLFEGKRETHDLLFAMRNVFLICFYNKNSTKLISSHSLHHKVPTDHMVDQWHLCKCMKFKEKNGTNMKSSTHHHCLPWRLPRQGHNVTKFYLSPAHTPFFWHSHWLPCTVNTFSCMLIGHRALQFIIYSPQSFDIQYLCIY